MTVSWLKETEKNGGPTHTQKLLACIGTQYVTTASECVGNDLCTSIAPTNMVTLA